MDENNELNFSLLQSFIYFPEIFSPSLQMCNFMKFYNTENELAERQAI